MKNLLIAGFAALALTMTSATAQEVSVLDQWRAEKATIFEADDIVLDEFVWHLRPLVVFAQSPEDPQFQLQVSLLLEDIAQLGERDVIIIVDTNPAEPSALRLQLRPRGFMLVLLDKEGQVEFRKPSPWSVREISRSIDKMPLRQQEIRDRRLGNG